ncbi:MAG: 50S ribosomal protein L25/general stress protein Ctc [Cyanobacteriota bacterium]
MEVTVECQKRPEGSKPKALRRSGLIPAVLYGHNGTESVSLTLNAKEAETLLKQATVNNTLVQVNVPELPWKGKALLREVQAHPWKKNVYHLSFFSVAAHGPIDVTVPLNLLGNAAGLKEGGVVDLVISELPMRCDPDKIPETIDVDISHMQIGDILHVGELVLPEGVSVLIEPGETVVNIAAPRTATATESAEAGTPAEA